VRMKDLPGWMPKRSDARGKFQCPMRWSSTWISVSKAGLNS
jgi:hypothetical protein